MRGTSKGKGVFRNFWDVMLVFDGEWGGSRHLTTGFLCTYCQQVCVEFGGVCF